MIYKHNVVWKKWLNKYTRETTEKLRRRDKSHSIINSHPCSRDAHMFAQGYQFAMERLNIEELETIKKKVLEVYEENKVSDTYCILRDKREQFIHSMEKLLCEIKNDLLNTHNSNKGKK